MSLFGSNLLNSLSEFDENRCVKFLRNLLVYKGKLNPVGAFPSKWRGRGKFSKFFDFDEILYARSLGTLVMNFLGQTPVRKHPPPPNEGAFFKNPSLAIISGASCQISMIFFYVKFLATLVVTFVD